MGNGSEKEAEDAEGAEGAERRGAHDRLWVLMDRAAPGTAAPGDPGAPPGARRTIVVRDGERVLISVPVGRGSALAVPLKIDQLPCAGARLVVRVASEITPCAECVEERLSAACAEGGGLGSEGILAAVHAALARCDAQRRVEPQHGEERPSEPPTSRTSAALRLAPLNAPHIPAGGAGPEGGDMDVILIF